MVHPVWTVDEWGRASSHSLRRRGFVSQGKSRPVGFYFKVGSTLVGTIKKCVLVFSCGRSQDWLWAQESLLAMILPSNGDSVWWLSWERQKTNSSNTPVNAALPASNRRFHYGCFRYVTLLKPVWWGFLSAVTKTSWQSFRPVVSLLPFLSKTAVLSCHQRQVRWQLLFATSSPGDLLFLYLFDSCNDNSP